MLDADETAGFDESMRQDPELRKAWREMNCLTAAVAATTVAPLAPRAGQLERLQSRLGLNASRPTNWLAITGWAAAAALTVVLVVDRKESHAHLTREIPKSSPSKVNDAKPAEKTSPIDPTGGEHPAIADKSDHPPISGEDGGIASREIEGKSIAKGETKRLIQEIEVLRDKLEGAQKRDQKRFEAVPGMAWPIIMTMRRPGEAPAEDPSITLANNTPSLTTRLGDALAGVSSMPAALAANPSAANPAATGAPTAIPIYDAARDVGTLVVTNLKSTNPDQPKFLWVKTENGDDPVLVGELPANNSQDSESLDFSLGKTAVVPTAFILTSGETGKPATPSARNTILIGP
jgi:hypothetical protein